jgi:tetratricopeptide (TPR) repeat protein
MTTSRIEGEGYFQQNSYFYNEQITKVIEPVLLQFERMMKSYVIFNIIFLSLGLLQSILLITLFTFLAESSILAFSLALIFLTFFSYFILRLYFQTKKPEQLKELKERYIKTCKAFLHYQENVPEHHIALANACCKLAESLNGKEYSFYRPPEILDIFSASLEKFSCWWHWQDVHRMKEVLLATSIDEQIKLVRCEPTNLEFHASLANAYVMLSGLYVDPRRIDGFDEERWIPSERLSEQLEEKFRKTAERAIEEFKILNDYAPNDPWVHAQLAYSYHDLQMPDEEIKEYETIFELNPDDKENLYKLGLLYFQQGHNAKGLRIYEKLKSSHYKKAGNLINYYGAYEQLV